MLEVPRIPTFDLEAAAAILQEAAEKTSVAPTTKPTTIRVPSGELAFGNSLVPQEVVRVEELMFVFGVANALGLARIQKQLIPDKLIPFLRKKMGKRPKR